MKSCLNYHRWMNRRKAHMLIFVASLGFFALLAYLYWQHTQRYPSTDDAYVNAHVTDLAAQVSGPVLNIYVQNYESVKKGQALIDIDPRPFQIAVDKANAAVNLARQKVAAEEATVQAAEAQVSEQKEILILAEKNANRMLPLVKTGRVAAIKGDQVKEKLNVSRAALAAAQENLEKAKQTLGQPGPNNADIQSAQAALAQAQLDLAHTHIVAPSDGRLINFTTRTGDMINATSILFSLIEEKTWWVDANFKETQLERIRVGQPVTIYVDLYRHHPFKGVVVNISQGSGSAFSLLPAENATGNWVKVTQRFPVKVMLFDMNPKYPLRVGASANVVINTTATHVNS